jgi:hypothetical protein
MLYNLIVGASGEDTDNHWSFGKLAVLVEELSIAVNLKVGVGPGFWVCVQKTWI